MSVMDAGPLSSVDESSLDAHRGTECTCGKLRSRWRDSGKVQFEGISNVKSENKRAADIQFGAKDRRRNGFACQAGTRTGKAVGPFGQIRCVRRDSAPGGGVVRGPSERYAPLEFSGASEGRLGLIVLTGVNCRQEGARGASSANADDIQVRSGHVWVCGEVRIA